MLKKQVVHRAEVKTVYSSQKQQRMKVYFDLTNQYKQCMQPCRLNSAELQPQCEKQCEKIYEQYIEVLKPRYQGKEQRIDMEVKNSPIFVTRPRKDRNGFFFDLVGVTFREFVGLPLQGKP